MGPNVGAVEVDKDCDVANESYLAFSAVGTQRFPLFIECELHRLLDFQLVLTLLLQLAQGVCIATGKLFRPGQPRAGREFLPQDAVPGPVRQPESVLFTK